MHGRDWTHEGSTSARTSFKLPVKSDTLYVFARGSLAAGKITIVDSESVDGGEEDVVVSVHVRYYTSMALDRANVCQLSRRRGENGIGIFVSTLCLRDGIRPTDLLRHPITGNMSERKTACILMSPSIYPPASGATAFVSKISKPTFLYSTTRQGLLPRP